jgi:hypothetical protein
MQRIVEILRPLLERHVRPQIEELARRLLELAAA